MAARSEAPAEGGEAPGCFRLPAGCGLTAAGAVLQGSAREQRVEPAPGLPTEFVVETERRAAVRGRVRVDLRGPPGAQPPEAAVQDGAEVPAGGAESAPEHAFTGRG